MLSELVIAKRGATSTESLSKQEVSDILKFGAEDLFKDDDDGKSKIVTYDEAAVQRMLDRSQKGEKETEKSFGMNEYLRSFKVATYQVKEADEKDVRTSFTTFQFSYRNTLYYYFRFVLLFRKRTMTCKRSNQPALRLQSELRHVATANRSVMDLTGSEFLVTRTRRTCNRKKPSESVSNAHSEKESDSAGRSTTPRLPWLQRKSCRKTR